MPKEAKPKKEKASKKKDPHAPKKALSPYMFFTQEWREKIKEENPGIGFGKSFVFSANVVLLISFTGEVAKRLGAKWKSMSDEEKEVMLLFAFPVHSLMLRPLALRRKAPSR
ncbi:Non-histone chromosomal protein 6 [Serendipita sp. 411]|nr:Non-histone chromosomal protein 6 [Serendipita sp. 411]